MTTLTILHLTDLHRGLGGYANVIYPNVEQILLVDLRKMYEKTGPWDLVCFTGDLVQSGGGKDGKGKEFEQLDMVLDRLWDEFGTSDPKPHLLTVPGNHDLQWPNASRSEVKLLKQWRRDPKIQASFWHDKTSDYRGVVEEALTFYKAWEEKNRFRSIQVQRGLLPGDFCLTFEKEGWKVGIVGLNTTFLQLGSGPHEGKLALHPAQLAAFHGDRYARWFQDHHFCLLLTHHPPEWLTPEAQEEYSANIASPGRFLAHLCGHLHEDWSEDVAISGAPRPRLLRGASLFGLEYFGKGKKQIQRSHGYGILRFDLDPAGSTWRRWPRSGFKLRGGPWKIDRNVHAVQHLEDDGGTVAEPIQLVRAAPSRDRSIERQPTHVEWAAPQMSPLKTEDVERLRLALESTLTASRQITTRIWQRLQSYVNWDEQEVEFRVEAQGDTSFRGIYSVQSSQAVPFIPFDFAADETSPEVHYLDELDFSVRLVGKTEEDDEIYYLQTDNFPRRKRVVVFFFPEIDKRQRKVEVTYRWPGYFAKLIQKGTDDLGFDWRRPVHWAEIRILFAEELGEVDCKLLSGQKAGVGLSRSRNQQGYLVWTCRCRNVPAGAYQLSLERRVSSRS
jgi:predicted MPP superfamily phosphohydrolase